MRLGRLGVLLGSASMVLAGGSAFAADFNPVVPPAAVGASYLEQCPTPTAAPAPENPPATPPPADAAAGDIPAEGPPEEPEGPPGPPAPAGFLKPGTEWCLTLSGNAEWSTGFGMTIGSIGDRLDPTGTGIPGAVDFAYEAWALNPADAEAQAVGELAGNDGWGGFGYSSDLTLVASTTSSLGPVTVNLLVAGGDDSLPSLSVGPWTFSTTHVSYYQAFGMLGFGVAVVQPGEPPPPGQPPRMSAVPAGAPLGTGLAASWGLALTAPIGVASYIPALRVPDFEGVVTYGGPIDPIQAAMTAYWGQRTTTYGGIGDFNTYGGSFGVTFRTMAANFQFGAAADRTVIDALGVSGAPYVGFTYGVRGQVGIEGERVDARLVGVVGINSGLYTGYKYVEQPTGTYWSIEGVVTVDMTDQVSLGLNVSYDDGPAATDDDGVIQIGSNLTFNPFDNFRVRAGVTYDWLQTGVTALGGSLGASIRF